VGALATSGPCCVYGQGSVWITYSFGDLVSGSQFGGDLGGLTTVGAGARPPGVAASPSADNMSVYVANRGGDSVSQYSVAADGWTLSQKSPPTVAAGEAPFGVAVSPNGKSVYVTNPGDNTISQYSTGAGGALSPKSPAAVAADVVPFGVAVSPDGRSVYVAAQGADAVLQFNADQASGALSPKNPASVAAGEEPTGVAVSADGKSVYATNVGGGTVSQYDVRSDGTLSPKGQATVAAGLFPFAIAVSSEVPHQTGRPIRLARSPVRVSRSRVAGIGVRCPTRRDRCRVRVALRRLGSAAVIARGRTTLGGGKSARVRVKLPRRVFRVLRRRGRLRVRVAARARHAAGNRSRRTAVIRLRAPRERQRPRAAGVEGRHGRSRVGLR
jgi:hypothetical protein